MTQFSARLSYASLMVKWLKVPVLVAAVSASVLGCTRPNPAATCQNGTCIDSAFPFCDADGIIDGDPNTCISVSCTPNDFVVCDGNKIITCNAGGDNYDVTACQNGCNAEQKACNPCTSGTVQCGADGVQTCGNDGKFTTTETCSIACADTPAPHCTAISPRYLPDICDAPATAASLPVKTGTLDVDDDATCNGGVITQTAAPSICVLRYGTINIPAGVTLTMTSTINQQHQTGGRAVAFVADGNLTVAGTLEVGATGETSGPGGGVTSSGGIPGSSDNGGGGAGFATAGGAGGSDTVTGGAMNGGAATADPALSVSLIGGSLNVGGGGGAATLISCRGSVVVTGTIDAHGGGGTSGSGGTVGGGGGAGGYMVLQGANVMVTGQAFANGGGGGAGSPDLVTVISDGGADGSRSDTTGAAGGDGMSKGGNGGAGGVQGHLPGAGLPRVGTTGSGARSGGGGGSVGFFQTYTPAGVTPTLTPSHASPMFQTNAMVPTR